jgi:hippurate hydrolase
MRHTIFVILCLLLCTPLMAQTAKDLSTQDYPYLEKLYLHLHQNPELSFYETNTAKRLAEELRQAGFQVTENFGGTGVVGILKNGPGPTVLIRADMDALPVVEETGKTYASKVTTKDESGNTVGVMHACGHDIHMTVWAGAARTLAKLKSKWSGTLIMVGQPAEERSGGAKAMLKEGLYSKFPKPDYALAIHVSPTLAAGRIGYRKEYTLANVDFMDITVYGQGGHGAYPQTTIDPIVLSARIITTLQTIVSRETSPLEPAVVTVGAIHGGAKGNVIPNEVQMQLTMRSYSDQVRKNTIEKIGRICRGEAIAAGLPESKFPKLTMRPEETPSTYNDPALTERIISHFKATFGDPQIQEVEPSMAGEDFALFGRTDEKVPIFLFWLGTQDGSMAEKAAKGEIQLPSLHSSRFCPVPEPTIKTGVAAMSEAALRLFKK